MSIHTPLYLKIRDAGGATHNIYVYEAVGDGVADDRQAFIDTEAAGDDCTAPEGEYLVSSNLLLTKRWTFTRGAVLKPANGVTIIINAQFEAGLYRCFDLSLGGLVVFTGRSVREFYPQWWGAEGDGVADDSPPLQAAGVAAGAGRIVTLIPAEYRTTTRLDITHDFQTWKMDGATISIDHTGTGVRVGQDAAVRLRRSQLRGGKIVRAGGTDWTPGSVGIEFLNVSWAKYRDFEVGGFESGVYLHANNGQGTVYIDMDPLLVGSCKFPFRYYAEDGGWVNENSVNGGSVSYSSTDPDATGGFAIHIDRNAATTTFACNNNKFHRVSLECAKPTQKPLAIYVNGFQNHFIDLRYEGFVEPFIKLGPDSVNGGNVFAWGRGLLSTAAVDWSAANKNFQLFGDKAVHIGGGSSAAPLLTLSDLNSVNNVALRVERPDGATVFEVGSDGKLTVGNGGSEIGRRLVATQAWEPPSLAHGATASVSVTVTGAVKGDLVMVGFDQVTAVANGGWHLSGQVTGGSTVRVVLTNQTGAIGGLLPGTLKVIVQQ